LYSTNAPVNIVPFSSVVPLLNEYVVVFCVLVNVEYDNVFSLDFGPSK
jgi:hypothetical protein